MNSWLNDNPGSGLLRGYSNSVFAYYGASRYDEYSYRYAATYTKTWSSRACIVVGTGI